MPVFPRPLRRAFLVACLVLSQLSSIPAHAVIVRGTVTDLGGPTANMYQMKCKDEGIEKACRRMSCVFPEVCENLGTDHGPLLQIMKAVREEPGVKKVFIASGVRYDLAERSPEFIAELAQHHTGGQLSVAPEHNKKDVLDKMKKPGIESYERFAGAFQAACEAAGAGFSTRPHFLILTAFLVLALPLAPFAAAAGLRQALE